MKASLMREAADKYHKRSCKCPQRHHSLAGIHNRFAELDLGCTPLPHQPSDEISRQCLREAIADMKSVLAVLGNHFVQGCSLNRFFNTQR